MNKSNDHQIILFINFRSHWRLFFFALKTYLDEIIVITLEWQKSVSRLVNGLSHATNILRK